MTFDPATGTVFHTAVHSPSLEEFEEWARARTQSANGVPVQKVVVSFLPGRARAEPHLLVCARLGLECRTFIEGVETVLVGGAARSTLVVSVG